MFYGSNVKFWKSYRKFIDVIAWVYGSFSKKCTPNRKFREEFTGHITKNENHTVIYEKNYGLNQHNRKSYRKWCEILRFIFSELKFLP